MDIHIVHRSHKIMKSLCILFFLTSLMLSSPFQNAWGITITDGNLDGDTTWTLDQSPYEVTVAINVGSGVTLTVEAGVVVKFVPGNFGIKVQDGGNLAVNGTADNPVYFTDYRDDTVGGDTNEDDTQPAAGSWDGIVVINNGVIALNFAHVRYAVDGVFITGDGGLVMNNCSVMNSEYNGVWLNITDGINTLSNCSLNGNGSQGITIWDLLGSVAVNGCSVSNNGEKGIWISDIFPGTPKAVVVTDCIISDNGNFGISNEYNSSVIKENKIFDNNECGIFFYDISAPDVFKNNIYGNDVGIKCADGANPLIGGSGENRNNIYGNASYGVNNFSEDVTITATHNCWGSLSGPYHSSNESGKGNPVSDHVDYDSYVPMSGFDGDLNNNDTVDLADAITALQVMTGFSPAVFHPEYVVMGIDINGDNRAGLAEAIYIIRNVSGL